MIKDHYFPKTKNLQYHPIPYLKKEPNNIYIGIHIVHIKQKILHTRVR